MKSSNHSSLDNIKALYDDTLDNDVIPPSNNPWLDQENDATNEFWNKDYRGMLFSCSAAGSVSYTIISVKNGDGSTSNFNFLEKTAKCIYLPLHVRITQTNKDNSFANLQIFGLK